jgi:hypothetical protein
MRRYIEVHDSPAVMGENQEDEENPEVDGRHGEEVDGNEVFDVVVQEGSPGWTRWLSVPLHVLGDGRLRDVDAKPRCTGKARFGMRLC